MSGPKCKHLARVQKYKRSRPALSEKGSVVTWKILVAGHFSLCKSFHVSMFFWSDAPIRTLTHEWAMRITPQAPGGHVSASTPTHAQDFWAPGGMLRWHAKKGFQGCRALPCGPSCLVCWPRATHTVRCLWPAAQASTASLKALQATRREMGNKPNAAVMQQKTGHDEARRRQKT